MVRHAAAAVALVFTLSPSWLSAQSTTFTVTTDSANIHKAPSTGSVVVGHAPRGRVLPVERELGSWVKVSWPDAEGGAGYVNVSWGKLGGRPLPAAPTLAVDSPSPRPAPQAAAAAAVAPAAPSRAVEPQAALRPVYVTPASHAFGLGARMGSSPMGFGAAARGWSRRRFGGTGRCVALRDDQQCQRDAADVARDRAERRVRAARQRRRLPLGAPLRRFGCDDGPPVTGQRRAWCCEHDVQRVWMAGVRRRRADVRRRAAVRGQRRCRLPAAEHAD